MVFNGTWKIADMIKRLLVNQSTLHHNNLNMVTLYIYIYIYHLKILAWCQFSCWRPFVFHPGTTSTASVSINSYFTNLKANALANWLTTGNACYCCWKKRYFLNAKQYATNIFGHRSIEERLQVSIHCRRIDETNVFYP